jgi:hypothetical protein
MSVFCIIVIICSGMQSNEIQNKIPHCTVSKLNPKKHIYHSSLHDYSFLSVWIGMVGSFYPATLKTNLRVHTDLSHVFGGSMLLLFLLSVVCLVLLVFILCLTLSFALPNSEQSYNGKVKTHNDERIRV